MADGDIRITLSFDDKDYTVRVKNAAKELSAFQQRADRTGQSVERLENHMNSLSTKFRHAVTFFGMARFALMDFYNVFLQLPQHILKTSGELERMTKLMEGLSKATDDASRKAEALSNKKFIIQTAMNAPFDIKALSDSFVKMKAAGLDPLDGSFKGLIDSVARFGGTSETLHRASIAIQQMAGKGVISMEELRQQLGEAVPDAMKMMADSMGLSIGVLVDHISKGEVKSEGALRRLALMMQIKNSGMAQEMMDTWVGSLARLQTQFSLTEELIAKSGFGNAMKGVVNELTNAMASGRGQESARQLGEALASAVNGAAAITRALYNFRQELQTVGIVIAAVWGAKTLFSILGAAKAGISSFLTWMTTTTVLNLETTNAAYIKHGLIHQQVTRQLAADTARLAASEAALNTARLGNRAGATARIALLQAETVALRASVVANTAAAAAIARTAAATRVMGGAMAFIAGPIGLITTALMLGVTAWELWGNSAANALEKAKINADKGQGTQDDLDAIDKETARLQGIVNAKKTSLARLDGETGNADGRKPIRDQLKIDLQNEIAENNDLIERQRKLRKKADINVIKTDGEARIALIDEQNNKQLAIISKQYNALEVEADKARKKELEGVTDKKKIEVIEKKHGDELTRIRKGIAQDHYVFAQSELVKAEEKVARLQATGGRELEIAKEMLAKRQEIAVTATRTRDDAFKMIGNTDGVLGDGKKKKGTAASRGELEVKDPLTKAVLLAEGEVAKAQRLLDNVQEGVNTFAAKRNAIAEDIFAEIAAGKWDDSDRFGKETTPGEDDARAQKLITAQTKLMEIADRKRAVNVLTKDQADLDTELAESSARLNSNLPEQASNLRSLAGAYAALGVGLSDEVKEAMKFDQLANTALLTQAKINVQNFTKSLMEQNEQLKIGNFIGTEAAQKELAYANAVRKSDEEIQGKIRDLQELNQTGEVLNQITALQAQAQMKREQMAEQHRLNMRTPIEKMAEDWKDSAKAMGEATAKWANDGVEAIITFVKTGKFEFKSFVETILADILRIQMRQNLAAPLAGLLGNIGRAAFGGAPTPIGGSVNGPSISALDNMFPMPDGFANGGIMTSAGRMPLHMYSSGGIANSPQMAMFGEGRMNEAYVPLPDGKTIPVTMKGGMGNVQVNVINQTGTPVSAQQQGAPRFDGERLILDVVLSAMQRPGSFRDGVKGAMT